MSPISIIWQGWNQVPSYFSQAVSISFFRSFLSGCSARTSISTECSPSAPSKTLSVARRVYQQCPSKRGQAACTTLPSTVTRTFALHGRQQTRRTAPRKHRSWPCSFHGLKLSFVAPRRPARRLFVFRPFLLVVICVHFFKLRERPSSNAFLRAVSPFSGTTHFPTE